MRRRQFMSLLAGAALFPRAACARDESAPPRIGILSSNSAAVGKPLLKCLMLGLRDRNWIEGSTLTLDTRWGGDSRQYPALAADLVSRKPDLIVTTGTPATVATQHATSDIPIVFIAVSDPVASKIVTSLARPGGNITGVSNFLPATTAKLLEYLRTAAPATGRVAVLYDANNPGKLLEVNELRKAGAAAAGMIVPLPVRAASDFEQAFTTVLQMRCDGLITLQDGLTLGNRADIVAFAGKNRLPAIYQIREFVDAGGLMSYGLNYCEHYRSAAPYVDRILKGAKPGDLPVELPTRFELVINMKVARTLGLEVPALLLATADQVIE